MTKLVFEGHLVDDDAGRQDSITDWHYQKVEAAVIHFRHIVTERFGSQEIHSYCSRIGIPQYGDKVCGILGR